MKYLNLLLMLLLFGACSKNKEVDNFNTVVRDDILYEVNSTEPFTGVVYENYESSDDKKAVIRKYEITYKDGVQNGAFETWYDNGQKNMEGNLVDDKLDGRIISFHKNGQLCSENIYKEGKFMEILRDYDSQGNPIVGNTLKKGNGRVKIYDEEDNLLYIDVYEDGELIRKIEGVEEVEVDYK